MKKEVPFFSVKEVNQVEDYERFYHSRAYLKQKSGDLTYYKNKSAEIRELARKSGYSHFSKFMIHRKQWHAFERKIPLKYLKAIKVKLDVLKYTVELDKQDYQEVLKLPLYPKYFIIKASPFFLSRPFPPDITEEEAIEILKEYTQRKNRHCLINYPGIKTVGVRPDGTVYTNYYEPEIKINKEYLVPTVSGKNIGKVFLI